MAPKIQRTLIPAVAYYRMSGDKQEASIPDQREAVVEFAAKNGYQIIREYADDAISGWRDDRKAFQRLIADADKGDFQAVLCWDQDRFSRFPVLEANHYWFLLDRAGVHIATINQGRLDLSSLAGWLTASIAQHGKSEYCRDLAKNTSRGLRKRKLAGEWVGCAPYGYRIGPDGHLVLGPENEIAVVRQIFSWRSAGRGWMWIVANLNRSGVKTPRGVLWSQVAVKHFCQRDAYLGHVVIGKHSIAKYQRLTDGIVTIKNTHPPIITQAEWDAVRSFDGAKRKAHWKGRGDGGPLGGVLECANCDTPMYRLPYRSHMEWTRYVCGNYHNGGLCGCCTVNESRMLELVGAILRERLLGASRRKLERTIAAKLERRKPPAPIIDGDGIKRQLAAMDKKIDLAEERILTVSAALVPSLEARVLEMHRQRSALHTMRLPEPKAIAKPDPKKIVDQLLRIPEILKTGKPDQVRQAIGLLIRKISIRFENERTAGQLRNHWKPVGGTVYLVEEKPDLVILFPFCLRTIRLSRADFARFSLAG